MAQEKEIPAVETVQESLKLSDLLMVKVCRPIKEQIDVINLCYPVVPLGTTFCKPDTLCTHFPYRRIAYRSEFAAQHLEFAAQNNYADRCYAIRICRKFAHPPPTIRARPVKRAGKLIGIGFKPTWLKNSPYMNSTRYERK